MGLERVYACSVNGHFSEVWNMKNRKLICQNIIFCTMWSVKEFFFCTRMHEKPYIYKCEDNLLYACANLFAPLDVSGHIYAYHIHVYNMLDDE